MDLKKFRLQNKMTHAKVAEKIGVAKNTYTQYEIETRKPSPETLCKLADIFNCSVDELLGRVPEQELFDDARIPKTEVQELFDQLPHPLQRQAIGYMNGLLRVAENQNSINTKKSI